MNSLELWDTASLHLRTLVKKNGRATFATSTGYTLGCGAELQSSLLLF